MRRTRSIPCRRLAQILVASGALAAALAEDPSPAPTPPPAAPEAAGREATAEETRAFLTAWSESLRGFETLEVTFRQEKKLRILKKPLVSTGTIRLARGRLLCTVRDARGDVETELQVDTEAKELKLHYPELARLEVYPLGGGHAPAMAFPVFGNDVDALERDFTVRLWRGAERDRLELAPRDPETPLAGLTLHIEDGEVKEVEQRDKDGGRLRLQILDMARDAKLPDGALDLVVPPGTRVIRR